MLFESVYFKDQHYYRIMMISHESQETWLNLSINQLNQLILKLLFSCFWTQAYDEILKLERNRYIRFENFEYFIRSPRPIFVQFFNEYSRTKIYVETANVWFLWYLRGYSWRKFNWKSLYYTFLIAVAPSFEAIKTEMNVLRYGQIWLISVNSFRV